MYAPPQNGLILAPKGSPLIGTFGRSLVALEALAGPIPSRRVPGLLGPSCLKTLLVTLHSDSGWLSHSARQEGQVTHGAPHSGAQPGNPAPSTCVWWGPGLSLSGGRWPVIALAGGRSLPRWETRLPRAVPVRVGLCGDGFVIWGGLRDEFGDSVCAQSCDLLTAYPTRKGILACAFQINLAGRAGPPCACLDTAGVWVLRPG